MPRSPYQGTFQYGIRPTVVTAPDALVYINGEVDILGCPRCKRRFDWNRYITSIQVDLNIESSPGSATLNLSVPRHTIDDFYFDGDPLITPMMEVEIFAKGYYLVEGVPQYYPIFWGLVTEVTDDYSSGEHTVTINCADILKWWELCMMNINPAFTQAVGQQGRSIFGNVFFGMNPYDVIWTLAQQSFGDVVVGTGSLISLVNEKNPAFKSTFRSALGDIMQYWNQRFSKIRSNLLLYGTTGTAVRGDVVQTAYQNSKPALGKPFVSQLVRQANGGDTAQMDFDPTDPSVVAFRTQFSQAGQVNFWQSEYQTKLELARAAKEAIGYEFYMDVTGDIVFKPPFYNLDVLSNKPVSWIQDIDVIDWSFTDSEADVVTQIQLQGNMQGSVDYGMPEEATPYTTVTDYHLLRKYGWRSHTYNSEFMASPQLMFYTGLDLLDRMNSKRFRGSCTIPLRPELRLGFPLYLASKDQIWYLEGISHSIQMGGRAQTSLTLTAKRGKFKAPRGIGSIELSSYKGTPVNKPKTLLESSVLTARQLSANGKFKATVGDAAQIPPSNAPTSPTAEDPYEPLILRHPKTGRIVGYPNVVMAYTRPFSATPDQLAKLQGQSTNPRTAQSKVEDTEKAAKKELDDVAQYSFTNGPSDDLRQKHLNNRYSYGVTSAGVYTYLHDKSQVILEMVVLPAQNITFNQETVKFTGHSGMIRPVSDERGFEVIGHHRYGRGVSLRDGSLVLSKGSNERAEVAVQVALSGSLYESIQAQSQGLTTVSTGYSNPADAVARLAPEDLQTAAVINPDTKKAEYVNTEKNFVSTAPLYSAERQGGVVPPDVEASQLSRALTLAEMQVRDGVLSGTTADPDCDCVTGRADLQFISVGYQVKSLTPTATDNSSLQEDVQLALNDYDLGVRSGHPEEALKAVLSGTSPEFQQAFNEALLARANADATASLEVSPTAFAPTGEALLNNVNRYLATLYSALDATHQQYEKELRGELLPDQSRTPDQVRFTQAPATESPLAPPYSAPGRAAGGDPEALAIQASTALNDISKTWESFGTKAKASAERAQLQTSISQSKSNLIALEAAERRLQTALDSGSAVVGVHGDTASQLKEVQARIGAEQQSIASDQAKLNQLNQEFPP